MGIFITREGITLLFLVSMSNFFDCIVVEIGKSNMLALGNLLQLQLKGLEGDNLDGMSGT